MSHLSVVGRYGTVKTSVGHVVTDKEGRFRLELPEAVAQAMRDRSTWSWYVSVRAVSDEASSGGQNLDEWEELADVTIALEAPAPGIAAEVRRRLDALRKDPLKLHMKFGADPIDGYGEAQKTFEWFSDAASASRSARKVLKEHEKDPDENIRALAYEALALVNECEDDRGKPSWPEDDASARRILDWAFRTVRDSKHGGHFALGVDLDDICTRCYGIWEQATSAAHLLGLPAAKAFVKTLDVSRGQPAIFARLVLEEAASGRSEAEHRKEYEAARPDFPLEGLSKLSGAALLLKRSPVQVIAPERDASPVTLAPPWFELSSAEWSPDGNRLIGQGTPARKWKPDLWLLDFERGMGSRVTWSGAKDAFPVWFPDGRRVLFLRLYERGRELRILDIATMESRSLGAFAGNLGSGCIDPEGRRVALFNGQEPYGLDILDLQTGKTERLLDQPAGRPAWSPDGKWIAFGQRPDLKVVEVATRTVRSLGEGGSFAWSPTASRLAFVVREPKKVRVCVAGPVEQTIRTLLRLDQAAEDHAPTWSSDGKRIAFLAQEEGLGAATVYLLDADGEVVFPLMEAGDLRYGLAPLRWRPTPKQ